MRHFVYRVDVHASGKSYIGVTTNLKGRLAMHRHAGRLPLEEGYNIYIVACALTREAAGQLEAELILRLNTIHPHGHNALYGGFDGRVYPEQVRELMSAAAQRRPPNFLGKKHSEASKRRMSAAKRHIDDAERERLRGLRRGAKLTEAQRINIRNSRSAEERAETAKRGWETRRANAAALPPR